MSVSIDNSYFFSPDLLDKGDAMRITTQALTGMDDGELFLEYVQSESFTFDDGRLKQCSYNINSGFGLRSVRGETTAFAHSSSISRDALQQASNVVRSLISVEDAATQAIGARGQQPSPLYTGDNPLGGASFQDKIALLETIDAYIRGRSPLVRQATISLAGEWQLVTILRPGEAEAYDVRPLVRLNISVIAERDGRMERGSAGAGGRTGYAPYINKESWQKMADEALRQALVNLDAVPAPAGEMPVVLGPGWPGVLLHEAVGHGLEGDFNRKKTSTYADRVGKRVASPGVTIVDDGTIPDRRGSLTIDDEGTPTQRTVLIEDGILMGYMQDRMNARLMQAQATGNGRREGYACQPMPRMTNTFMLPGTDAPQDLIAGVKRGVYAPHFGGGQVDITSGKFVFSASEAYLIENGKLTSPLKGMTLIGNGPDTMSKVIGIGNDLELDPGIGTCGKAGQSVPVGVGQPTLLIERMTVGGTASGA